MDILICEILTQVTVEQGYDQNTDKEQQHQAKSE
jgi:hypothetical protein